MKKRAIRVFLTEGCNANCGNCFNKDARQGKELTAEEFSSLCKYLSEAGFNVLKVMGGEPTVHSQFADMIEIAQKYFARVSVFTNALNGTILSFSPRGQDTIVYNMNFESTLTEEKLLLDKPGRRTLKYQISVNTDISLVKQSILMWRTFSDRIKPSFTYDCTCDIFQIREVLLEKTLDLEHWLKKNSIRYGFDHNLPLCFYKDRKESVGVSYPAGRCNVETAGLVDSHLNLRYCNQHHDVVINLKKDNDFIPWEVVKNSLLLEYYKVQISVLESGCIECKAFGTECNGGCWGVSSHKLPFM